MAIAYKSWVSETGTLTGTDPTYTLPNTATTGSGNQYLRTVGAAFTAATDIVLTISNSSGAETSVWSFTPGTGGAAGTITRSQLIESTTGSAINWSSATVTLECANPAPVQTSAGATSAGLLGALGSDGRFDKSVQIPRAVVPSATAFIAWPWFGANNNFTPAVGTLYRQSFYWLASRPVAQLGVMTETAVAGATARLGLYSIDSSGSPSSLIFDSGDISCATAYAQALGTNTYVGSLPPGPYIIDMWISAASVGLAATKDTTNNYSLTIPFTVADMSTSYQFAPGMLAATGQTYGAFPSTPIAATSSQNPATIRNLTILATTQ